jgi:hypothetical protein
MSMTELQVAAQQLSPQELHQFASWVVSLDAVQSQQAFFALPKEQQRLLLQQAAEEAAREGLYSKNAPLREWLDAYVDDQARQSRGQCFAKHYSGTVFGG